MHGEVQWSPLWQEPGNHKSKDSILPLRSAQSNVDSLGRPQDNNYPWGTVFIRNL